MPKKLYEEAESPSVVMSLPVPKSVDPWIVDQLDKRARRSWAGRELDKKADLDWVKERFSSLQREADSTQSTMKEYKGKLSNAPKRHEMEDLKGTLTGWSGWFRKSIVGIVIFIVGSIGTVGWNYSALNSRVEAAHTTTQETKEGVEAIEDSQRVLEQKLELIQMLLEKVLTTPDGRLPY